MKRTRFMMIFIIAILFISAIYAQTESEKPPRAKKYGLVLSGGGAKGLAHIGVLKMIDSLEIHIDYLTGTSMGSILSGLYSIGYSADSLQKIVENINWDRILSNQRPYNLIHLREKDEYDYYAVEFPIEKGLPTLPNFLIEGQYLSEVLAKYTFEARDIHNFHALPIPLELMTSDIVNGGTIVQQKGYLPLAIRASVSIPAIFSPTVINNKLLVDGGLDRNYPVEEIKKMGADVVIGSYTGYRIQSRAELKQPLKLINQTYAFNARKDAEAQMAMADTTIDFSEALKQYSPGDFKKYKEIIRIGERQAQKFLPLFLKIKQEQLAAGITYGHKPLPKQRLHISGIRFYDEDGLEMPRVETTFIRNILGNDINALDDADVLQQKTDRVMGYNFLDKFYYTYSNDSAAARHLNFHLKKKPKGTFHAAIHYDTNESAGIILNYTYRDLLLNHSRLAFKIDVAERMKLRVNYYKFLDNTGKYWLKTGFDVKDQKSNDLYFKFISQAYNFSEINFFQSNLNLYLNLGVDFNHTNGLYLGIDYNRNRFRNPYNLFSRILEPEENTTSKPIYTHSHIALNATYQQNNLNKRFFATKGNEFKATSRLFIYNKYRLNKPNERNTALTQIYNTLHPDSNLTKQSGNILQLSLHNHNALPLFSRVTLHSSIFYGINLDLGKNMQEALNPETYLFLSQKFYTGGYANFNNNTQNIFTGLKP